MEWLAPFPAAMSDARLPIGDVRALVQRGWWSVLAMYHAQLDEQAQEMIRGYLRQHRQRVPSVVMWCADAQPPLPLVPGYALMTAGSGVRAAPPPKPKPRSRRSDENERTGVMRPLTSLELPHLWRAGEAWTDGGDAHVARFGKTRIYLMELEVD